MIRDKHYPDDETVPRSTWWLLNGAGRPPTWRQLEQGAIMRRREVPLGKGKERAEDEGGTREMEDAVGGAQAAETAKVKPTMVGAGARGPRIRGSGTLGRLINRLQKRPANRSPSSDVVDEDGASPESSQYHEARSRSDTS